MNEPWKCVHVYVDEEVEEAFDLAHEWNSVEFRRAYADELVIDQPYLIVRISQKAITIIWKER